MRVEAAALLPAEPEAVWDLLLRWEDQARWIKDADWVRVLTSRREGIGTRIAVRNRVLNVPLFTEELEAVVWEPPRRLGMAHRTFVRGVGTWTLSPEGAGTRLTWVEQVSLPVPLLGGLALLVYRPFMRRLMRDGLENLRALLLAV